MCCLQWWCKYEPEVFTRTDKHKKGSSNRRNCKKRGAPYRPNLNGGDAPQLAARFLEWYILQGHDGYQVGGRSL